MFITNPKIHFSHLSKSLTYCFLSVVFILSIVSISGCFKKPHPSSAIEGDIEISTNDKNDLCFKPLFATTVLHEQPIQIKYIKMRRLEIYNLYVPEDESRTMLTIAPVDDEYYIIKKGEKICLNTDNPNLKQNVYKSLEQKFSIVSIGGIDDKEEEYVYFSHDFDYPYVAE